MKYLESLIGKALASRSFLHLAFCLAFVAFFSVSLILSGNYEVAVAAMLSCLYVLACTYAGRWYGISWLNRSEKPVSLSKSVSLFLLLVFGGATGAAYMFKGDVAAYFLQNLFICLPISVLFVFFGTAITLARHVVWTQVQNARILQEQKESELRLLLSQLSPHFLFNTLNNIYGISLTQQQRVPKLLLKLSELLRYSVYETREAFIPLKNELLYLKNYIDFEKIQTGDRLVLDLAMDENPKNDIRIAPMLLIVFVENAFKFSKATRKTKMLVAITLNANEDWINFSIKNSFEPDNTYHANFTEPSGVGLHHTLKRLDLIYGKDYSYNHFTEGDMYQINLQLKAK
jgi:hypothetical protein